MLITTLRTNPATASITVRDLYKTRTIGKLVERAVPDAGPAGPQRERHTVDVIGTTVAQALWLAAELAVGSILAYVGAFWVLPWLTDSIGLTGLVVVAPVILSVLRLASTPLTIEIAVRAKRMLIGKYTAVRTPVWSPFHVRIWIVRQFMRFIPWGTIAGTEYTSIVLRKLALVYEVALEAVMCRMLGPVSPGVISRYSLGYIGVWLKTGLVDSAGKWLSGGIFWPMWLRAAGMRVGAGCEISTIIEVVPELVQIDADTFFADGIYLCGPKVQRGTVTLGQVSLGANTFLGNHAVIAAGQRLPSNILIGISTVADDRLVRPGTSWFGHPPFELPQREIVSVDRSLTHEPSLIRVINRNFWEWLRFTLPVVPLIAVSLWMFGVEKADEYLDTRRCC